MVIHVREFVYGHIRMNQTNSPDARELTDDNGNRMTIRIGDELIMANSSPNQSWINDGQLTGFNTRDDQRLDLEGLSVHVGGECYIGRK